MEPESKSQPEFIKLDDLPGAFSFEEGYTRPNWQAIYQTIKRKAVGALDLEAAWNEVARQWLKHLSSDLGLEYRLEESGRFMLLTSLGQKTAGETLAFAERTLDLRRGIVQ